MSIHKSLKVKNRHSRARNVLSREERIERLEEEERWSEGNSIFRLAKVRVETVAPRKRSKEEKPEEAPGEAVAEGAAEEAPEKP